MASKTRSAQARAAAKQRRKARRQARKTVHVNEARVEAQGATDVNSEAERTEPRQRTVTDSTAVDDHSDHPFMYDTSSGTKAADFWSKAGEAPKDGARTRTITADTAVSADSDTTAVSDLPIPPQSPVAVSSAPLQGHARRKPKKQEPNYPARSPYNPDRYRCSGYDDSDWVFFDGMPGKGKDERFTIDLEGGSMDRLRDVRPYLYYVGYYCSEPTEKQPELEKKDKAEVEDEYVKRGRKYLLEQREKKVGYFLAKREWSEHNRCEFAGWPFQAFVQSEAEEGDVGFEERHEEEQFEEDCEGHVVKTNIRSPLPKEHTLTTLPGDPRWDEFIRWIYHPDIHGAHLMLENWDWREIKRNRIVRGTGFCRWLNKKCLDG